MPTKQGGRALKKASTSDRCSFRRNTALPAASTPCSWKTRLAMSKPTVVIFMVDGSFSSLHSTARAWHIDAVRGRPPHQIRSTRYLSYKAINCSYWEPRDNPKLSPGPRTPTKIIAAMSAGNARFAPDACTSPEIPGKITGLTTIHGRLDGFGSCGQEANF